jgi:hypothetical protein
MYMRKTLKTERVLELGNTFLRESADDQRAQRLGVASFLEAMLHEADAYKGYQHLDSAGVNYDEIARGGSFSAADDSRRVYLKARGL